MLSSARRISPAAAGFFQQVEDIRQSLMSFSVKCGVLRSDERQEYFAPTEAHRRWRRAVVLWTAGATAEKEMACIVTLRRAGLHALAFCRRGYQRGIPFGASLVTFCASRKSPAPESGTPLFRHRRRLESSVKIHRVIITPFLFQHKG